MMINKRLIGTVAESKKYIAGNVILQWCSLTANIALMLSISRMLAELFRGSASVQLFTVTGIVVILALAVRFFCSIGAAKMGYFSSKAVKKSLREKIYQKLLRLGSSYNEQVKTSEVVQVAVEGVDQLETYFGAYLPQFFYAMLAPLTLFIVLCFVNVAAAVVLLICVPLIPVAIAAVQTWAKKLLSKYWGQYTELGDTFLENLQGLTTLKIYQADAFKQQEMNEQAEKFRKITMKVLTMQLNSVTLMDLMAYGGAGLGIISAASAFAKGQLSLTSALTILLLAADFFLPLRLLGSYFHIAMNGAASAEKIFRLLSAQEPEDGEKTADPADSTLALEHVTFGYEKERTILHDVSLTIPQGSFVSLVGESGCGKSTLASILMGRNKGYTGSVSVGGVPLSSIQEESLLRNITYISHQSYLFKGTVRENLLMGKPGASDEELWAVLSRVNLAEFLKAEQGLDTRLLEKASNLSGGQCQRLALARALLHDSPVYIFDEATSNIDVESENDIMREIHELAKSKTVILVSHRLANVVGADHIYVLDHGIVAESGSHEELLAHHGLYERLWSAQQTLEQFGKERASV